MASLRIPVRYYRQGTDPEIPSVEANLASAEKTLEIQAGETALILVDCWDTHYLDSWLARAHQVTVARIAPVLAAARQAGLTIIHAPAPDVAPKYPQWTQYAAEGELFGSTGSAADWPPREFVERQGCYAGHSRPAEPVIDRWRAERRPAMRIDPAVEPWPEDYLVATGSQLQRLLRHRRILHLIYAGFATNVCVLYRDYGMLAFHDRGYNLILLRDCTTGLESHDTVDQLLATRLAIRYVETFVGWSATSEDVIRACRRPADKRSEG